MSQWQPIETAPKDGSYFIASDGYKVCVAQVFNKEVCWIGDYCICQGWPTPPFTKITHWMPLPNKPKAKGVQS